MAENWTAETASTSNCATFNTATKTMDFQSPLMAAVQNKTSLDNVTAIPTIVNLPAVAVIVPRLFYNELERVLFALFVWACSVLSLLLNLLLLAIIGRDSRLHSPDNMIIASDAVNNVVLMLTGPAYLLAMIYLNKIAPNSYVCQTFGFLSAINLCVASFLIVIYSYERYFFLCSPLAYAKRITRRRVALAVVVAIVMATVVICGSSYSGRVFSLTALCCVSRDSVKANVICFVFGALPSMVMALYAVINIKRLQGR
jgi:hypothetical protein